jgi:hypothetical protein
VESMGFPGRWKVGRHNGRATSVPCRCAVRLLLPSALPPHPSSPAQARLFLKKAIVRSQAILACASL